MSKQHVEVTLEGEPICTAIRDTEASAFVFWNRVIVDEICDITTVIERLEKAKKEQRIRYEMWPHTRTLNIPPAYKVTPIDVLS